MSKHAEILRVAEEASATTKAWADLSNFLFDPSEGLLAKAYPSRAEREEFVKTPAYRRLRELVERAQDKTDLVEGSEPRKSGKFVVRLPRSLHSALEREATGESVSLNQLVVAKLAVQLHELGRKPLAAVIRAFAEVRDGFSVDRVVADPLMNRRFLERCRALGGAGSDYDLNHLLFYARKNNKLTHLPKTRRYTPRNSDEYEYASEIAVRYIQMQQNLRANLRVSLDEILCDPALAAEFDGVASKLAPGFSPLEYRWAALGLRKASRFSEAAHSASLPNLDVLGRTKQVKVSQLPSAPGIYLFRHDAGAIFAGETQNLRRRINRHFEHGGLGGVPQWLYDVNVKTVELGVLETPSSTHSDRKITELGLVYSLKPVLNYLRGRENKAA